MIEKTFTIKNDTGLHARPAAEFSKIATSYNSIIKIKKGSVEVNAKSIISVLSLGASMGTVITIVANGEDEKDAIAGMITFLDSLNA